MEVAIILLCDPLFMRLSSREQALVMAHDSHLDKKKLMSEMVIATSRIFYVFTQDESSCFLFPAHTSIII